jgi:hypothetical protein
MPNIEELLKQAIQAGKFNGLPGKGKPLKLDGANPHADPEWELAYHMLRDAGYSLPWIEQFQEIDIAFFNARATLKVAWEHRRTIATGSLNSSQVDAEWERALATFKGKIAALNKRIRDVNLQVPNPRFQRPVLNAQFEVDQITTA